VAASVVQHDVELVAEFAGEVESTVPVIGEAVGDDERRPRPVRATVVQLDVVRLDEAAPQCAGTCVRSPFRHDLSVGRNHLGMSSRA